jgi:hypothetical protein
VTLTRCFDAAYPPGFVPLGAGAVLGYIGSDWPDPERLDRNFRTWTPADWLPFKSLRQFPVWECNPANDPKASAANAVSEMRELGWHPGRAIVGAMETFTEPRWWAIFEDECETLGQWPVCYGSADFVYANNPRRVWEALYDGVPQLPANPLAVAKQYLSLGGIDWSVVAPALVQRGGQGPRNQAA